MKKIILSLVTLFSLSATFAQKSAKELLPKPGDHIMLQLSSDYWTGVPDSIKNHMKGLSRGGNIYVMMNKPFKTNPKLSIAFGVGIGTSSMYFKTMNVDITAKTTKLPFVNLDSSDRFKKYKLTTAYLEVPLEFRFTSDPDNDKKSIKAAIGVKVGTMLSAHTKGKTLQNKSGTTTNSFTEKESSKKYFNTTRLSLTGRIGYGHFSLFGSYQINNLFKDGVAAGIKPFQVGITLSGL
jgi:hypothetical protein